MALHRAAGVYPDTAAGFTQSKQVKRESKEEATTSFMSQSYIPSHTIISATSIWFKQVPRLPRL